MVQVLNDPIVNPGGTQAMDVDGDGDQDLLVTTYDALENTNRLVWFNNVGGGKFTRSRNLTGNVGFINATEPADLDGDGDADLLVVRDGGVNWYENLGGGLLGPPQFIVAENAIDLQAADIDGDGDQDFVTTFDLAWYENDGTGSFAAPQAFLDTNGWEYGVEIADLDSDGDNDVLSISVNQSQLSWWENLGGGSFATKVIISTEEFAARYIDAEDLDGDGDLDLVTASYGNSTIGWYENLGGTVFSSRQLVAAIDRPGAVIAVDVDGDGDRDITCSGFNFGGDDVGWVENLGSGVFGTLNVLYSREDSELHELVSADFDQDGDEDLVFTAAGRNLVGLLENQGGGNFLPTQEVSGSATQPGRILALDFDDDGDLDAITASISEDKLAWHENQGDGDFGRQQVLTYETVEPWSLVGADIDGDGNRDLLVAGRGVGGKQINWYRNLGNGQLGPREVVEDHLSKAVSSVAAGDLDGDGDQDVVSASSDGETVTWNRQDDNGDFDTAVTIDASLKRASTVFCADLDGDGDLDVIASSLSIGSGTGHPAVYWYENLGAGSFGPRTLAGDFAGGARAYALDMDTDGDLDIVTAGKTADWVENLGGANFGSVHNISAVAVNWIDVRDVDGDGDYDAVTTATSNQSIKWYERLGDGSFSNPMTINQDVSFPIAVTFADWDQDGDADVLASSGFLGGLAYQENLFDPSIGTVYCDPAVVNSTTLPGSLTAVGSPWAPNNDLVLSATNLPANKVGLMIVSANTSFLAGPGGSQGNLCLGAPIARFKPMFSDASGTMTLPVNLQELPNPGGPIAVMSGDTWHFQVWYRDTNPGTTSNLTSGLSISFQ